MAQRRSTRSPGHPKPARFYNLKRFLLRSAELVPGHYRHRGRLAALITVCEPLGRLSALRHQHGCGRHAVCRRYDHLQRRLRSDRRQRPRPGRDGPLGDKVLQITDELDAAGNTAKAITKGFAIGAAGLTVIALLAAYQEILSKAGVTGDGLKFDILNPLVFFGLMVGIAVPAVFSAMLIMGVDRNAERMVAEIHRQFDTIPGLKEGKEGVKPDYNKCIDIATVGAIKELIPAGLMAIIVTLAVGFIGGVHAIGGFLAGNITSGLLLALLMSNAGGLWDNAKKHIEAGNYGGKGSDAHKAGVIGDTVGDPFKDTAGPSLNSKSRSSRWLRRWPPPCSSSIRFSDLKKTIHEKARFTRTGLFLRGRSWWSVLLLQGTDNAAALHDRGPELVDRVTLAQGHSQVLFIDLRFRTQVKVRAVVLESVLVGQRVARSPTAAVVSSGMNA
jgi:hypothetical protein